MLGRRLGESLTQSIGPHHCMASCSMHLARKGPHVAAALAPFPLSGPSRFVVECWEVVVAFHGLSCILLTRDLGTAERMIGKLVKSRWLRLRETSETEKNAIIGRKSQKVKSTGVTWLQPVAATKTKQADQIPVTAGSKRLGTHDMWRSSIPIGAADRLLFLATTLLDILPRMIIPGNPHSTFNAYGWSCWCNDMSLAEGNLPHKDIQQQHGSTANMAPSF